MKIPQLIDAKAPMKRPRSVLRDFIFIISNIKPSVNPIAKR